MTELTELPDIIGVPGNVKINANYLERKIKFFKEAPISGAFLIKEVA
jgi:hypothetical protein